MNQPVPQVTRVKALPGGILEVHFDSGERGRFQLSAHLPFTGYFAPLAQSEFFHQVYVEYGTLCWPGDIDLDPIIVHAWAMNVLVELAGAPVAQQ